VEEASRERAIENFFECGAANMDVLNSVSMIDGYWTAALVLELCAIVPPENPSPMMLEYSGTPCSGFDVYVEHR
jgi:hypothetical protein